MILFHVQLNVWWKIKLLQFDYVYMHVPSMSRNYISSEKLDSYEFYVPYGSCFLYKNFYSIQRFVLYGSCFLIDGLYRIILIMFLLNHCL